MPKVKTNGCICDGMGSAYRKIYCAVSYTQVLTKGGWHLCTYGYWHMSDVAEIQKALNVIRDIERTSNKDARLAALALITSTASDIAREIRELDPPKAKQKPTPPLPIPAPTVPSASPHQQQVAEPKPFTEPERNKR